MVNTPIQVVNAYLSAKCTAKEYRPLLQWMRAHVTLDSCLVLPAGDFRYFSFECVFYIEGKQIEAGWHLHGGDEAQVTALLQVL